VEYAKYMDSFIPDESEWSALVPIKTSGTKPPLYMVHGIGSTASYYFKLSEYIDEDQPLYGFQALGLNGKDTPHQSIEEMALHYNSLILKTNPNGPYVIGGYSFGSAVAFEMAAQLVRMGKVVSKLIIFDTPTEFFRSDLPKSKKIELRIKNLLTDYFIFSFKEPKDFFQKKVRAYSAKFEKYFKSKKKGFQNKPLNQKDAISKVVDNNRRILNKYTIQYCPIHIYLFRTSYQNFYVEEPKYFGWKPFTDGVTVVPVTGYHDNMFVKPEHLKVLAKKIKETLEEDN
jgi:thioesterase domain-containing protein